MQCSIFSWLKVLSVQDIEIVVNYYDLYDVSMTARAHVCVCGWVRQLYAYMSIESDKLTGFSCEYPILKTSMSKIFPSFDHGEIF